MPYLKLESSDYTIYLKLEKRELNEEWLNSTIEIRDGEGQVKELKPLWYYSEPSALLSTIENFLAKYDQQVRYELMDDPTIEFVFDNEDDDMILRLYRSFELRDHLALYLDLTQVKYLAEYLKLFTERLPKQSEKVALLYDKGVLQGD